MTHETAGRFQPYGQDPPTLERGKYLAGLWIIASGPGVALKLATEGPRHPAA